MGERDKKQHRSSESDSSQESAPSGFQGPLQLLVERFGEAGANAIYKREVQRRRAGRLERESTAQVQAAAEKGISGAGGPLPHLDAIQKSFGRHDVSHVQAHTGSAAAEGAAAMGAQAFATGDHVAFAGKPNLHTAAHEAAHVVQQRAGVQLKGGVGEAGDSYEMQADAAADAAVAGRSAEGLLGQPANAPIPRGPVQHKKESTKESKDQAKKRPIPHWNQLPPYAQEAISSRGFDEKWYDDEKQSDEMRVTVLNLFAKLQGLGLWDFVKKNISSDVGKLEFECTDVDALKKILRGRSDFTNPERSDVEWSSREERAVGKLHFKHFKDWPKNKVQAHIDQAGLLLHHPIITGILSFGIATAIEAARHGIDYVEDGYKQPREIREILLRQGWDPATLKGK
jgi:hypothetical protein